LLKIPIAKKYSDSDTLANTRAALRDNYIVFVDFPSAKLVLEGLGGEAHKYLIRNLFGTDHPLRTWAGFAFANRQTAMRDYFWYHCVSENGHVRTAIDTLDPERLKELEIEVLPPKSIKQTPVEISAAENFLIQLSTPVWDQQSRLASEQPSKDEKSVREQVSVGELSIQALCSKLSSPARDHPLLSDLHIHPRPASEQDNEDHNSARERSSITEVTIQTMSSNPSSTATDDRLTNSLGHIATIGYSVGVVLVLCAVALWFGRHALDLTNAKAGLVSYALAGVGVELTLLSSVVQYSINRMLRRG
jgi:hypothetical protein